MDKYVIEKLNDTNFESWKVQFTSLCQLRGCKSALQKAPDEKSAKFEEEQKHDEMAVALLNLHVEPSFFGFLAEYAGAAAKFAALEQLFRDQSVSRLLLLKGQLSSLKKQPNESISAYVERGRSIFNQIACTGHAMAKSELVLALISGLPAEFDPMVGPLSVSCTVEELQRQLLPFEQRLLARQQEQAAEVSRQQAFAAQQAPAGQQWGGRMGGRGNFGRGGFGRGYAGRGMGGRGRGPRCWGCGELGHLQRDCPAGQHGGGQHQQQQQPFAMMMSGSMSSKEQQQSDPYDWIVDSGASKHVTPFKFLFESLSPLPAPTTVTFGNGQAAPAAGQGNILLHVTVQGEQRTVLLRNVLWVPGAAHNLLSVQQATSLGRAEACFSGQQCVLSAHGKPIIIAHELGGLYSMRVQPVQQEQAHMGGIAGPTQLQEKAELWHRRFCHLGADNMARLVQLDMVEGMGGIPDAAFKQLQQGVCEPCVMGKQSRLPFPSGDGSKADKPLALLHMDLCGPMPVASLGGCRYFATILDDYSGLSVVTPLRSKDQTAAAVRSWIAFLEKATGAAVRIVRTDRGGEYLSTELEQYFADKGIQHQLTAPYTPQQNGAAERLNRTLMERVRAMLQDMQLPQHLWAEAVVAANYVRNRSPSLDRSQTPWELLMGSKPDVSLLRVFGARAYVHVPKHQRSKLDSKSQRGIMVGYSSTSKAWRILLDDGNNQIVESRDVLFDETQRSAPPAHGAAAPGELLPPLLDDDDSSSAVQPAQQAQLDHQQQQAVGDMGQPLPAAAVPAPLPAAAPPAAAQPDAAHPAAAGAGNSGMGGYPQRNRRAPGQWWMASPQANIMAAAADVKINIEPATYQEALAAPDAEQWKQAMDEEMASLHANGTWVLEPLPAGVKAIPVKWVFKLKHDASGNIERYKARLVAKGFMQREGIDFNEVYAPVSKAATMRTLLSLVAADDLELEQLDIKTAFLNGDLEETIYMQQPPGYQEGGSGMACRLVKALYGLRQAPRAWHTRLKAELEAIGFTATEADASLFVRYHKDHAVYLLVYVDDILIVSSSAESVKGVKDMLTSTFDLRDLGEASMFVGLEIQRDRAARTLTIRQSRMANDLVARYGMQQAQPKAIPLTVGTQLTKASDDSQLLDKQQFGYAELIGSLLYLSVCTRPDIAQAVGALSRFMAAPTFQHWQAARGVVRYLSGTVHTGISYGHVVAPLVGYCDADFAGDVDTRRSTTGYVFVLNGGAISWSSRRQPTVALSTAEAEYMAAAHAIKEALWLRKLFADLRVPVDAIDLRSDNQAAIALLKNPIASNRSKHIDVLHHFARERVIRGEVCITYCSTHQQLADCLTKPVGEAKFLVCLSGWGML